MTAKEIQRRLLADCYRRRTFACPNYTPKDWWECDVFELTKTGRFREYEVKLSRADFLADKWKAERYWDEPSRNYKFRRKHDFLTARDSAGPTQFWFVTTEDLISSHEIPGWAGLIWASPSPRCKAPWNIRLETIRQAPKLHNEQADENIRSHLFRTFYHRFQWWYIYNQKEAA